MRRAVLNQIPMAATRHVQHRSAAALRRRRLGLRSSAFVMDPRPHPAVRRIRLHPRVPEQRDREAGHGEGQLEGMHASP